MRDSLKLLVGAVFGIAFVTTCGQMNNQMVSNHDGGAVGGGGGGAGGGGASGGRDIGAGGGDGMSVADLASGLFDIATADAQAAPPAMSAACDKIHTVAGENYYLAEFSVPTVDPTMAPSISAVICGFQTTGSIGPPPFFNSGGTGYMLPSSYCVAAPSVIVASGKVVVYCGAQASNGSGGWNATTVYLRVN